MIIKIRFNHDNKTDLFWRLIIDGVEKLCTSVVIHCPAYTSQDELPDGKIKFHITCEAQKVIWNDEKTAEII